MELLSVIAFAVALSLDGFGAGIAYGMRKIRIPILSLVVISLTSSTTIGISMLFGHLVSRYISIKAAEGIGASILILVGLWIVLHTWSSNTKKTPDDDNRETSGVEPILNFRIKAFGLVIQILREPTVADIDKSGYLSIKEALLLGLALAMDAFGAGFGAAMTGFGPLVTPIIVGVVKFLLVSSGVYIGKRYAAKWLGGKAAVLPGWVLIGLGVARVMKI